MHRKVLKSDPSDVRANNIRTVFLLVAKHGNMSRAELGRRMGLSRMAISDVVSEMVQGHLLREVGLDHRVGRGKRSVMLSVDTDGLRVASVDLTQRFVLRAVLTDLLGHVVKRVEIPREADGSLMLSEVDAVCGKVLGVSDCPLLGLGVAVPGVVDSEGIVIRSVNLGWADVDLKTHLEASYGLPVLVCNDANMGLLAECTFGNGSPNCMFVNIGPGVGAAVCVDGNIVDGSGYCAGEIGHVMVDPNGPQCVCGKRGCLELMLNVPKLRAHIEAQPDARQKILSEGGAMLGDALAMSTGLLDLTDIAVAGPPDIVERSFLSAMREQIKRRTFVDYHPDRLSVHRCEQGADLVLRGQAQAVIDCLVDSIHARREPMSDDADAKANGSAQHASYARGV